jgi:hypothetical protein
MRHYNIASREGKIDEKCERLAKQIIDIAGGKVSKLLQCSITKKRLTELLGERFSELEKLPSNSNLNRLLDH